MAHFKFIEYQVLKNNANLFTVCPAAFLALLLINLRHTRPSICIRKPLWLINLIEILRRKVTLKIAKVIPSSAHLINLAQQLSKTN